MGKERQTPDRNFKYKRNPLTGGFELSYTGNTGSEIRVRQERGGKDIRIVRGPGLVCLHDAHGDLYRVSLQLITRANSFPEETKRAFSDIFLKLLRFMSTLEVDCLVVADRRADYLECTASGRKIGHESRGGSFRLSEVVEPVLVSIADVGRTFNLEFRVFPHEDERDYYVDFIFGDFNLRTIMVKHVDPETFRGDPTVEKVSKAVLGA